MFTDALEQMLEVVTYCLENKHESDAVTTFEVMDDLMELVRAHAVSNSYECGLSLCLCLYVYMHVCVHVSAHGVSRSVLCADYRRRI